MHVNLDRLISIDYKSVEIDPTYGSEVVTWLRLATMRAEIRDFPPARSEAVVGQELTVARNLTRIRIRYRPDIDSAMRVVAHGDADQVYQIIGGPAELGRRQYLQLTCERYTS